VRIFSTKLMLNFVFWFVFFYLVYHTIHGQYNIQNYLINNFEKKMFEDFNYRLKQDIIMVNKDLHALYFEYEDMNDEIFKRKYPLPVDGEVLIKID